MPESSLANKLKLKPGQARPQTRKPAVDFFSEKSPINPPCFFCHNSYNCSRNQKSRLCHIAGFVSL